MAYKLTDPTTIESLKNYARSLERFFERESIERKGRHLSEQSLTAYIDAQIQRDDSDGRYQKLDVNERRHNHRTYAWLRDSLLWTIEELLNFEKGDRPYVHAFRGYAQVMEYAGRVGHDSTTADAATLVRSILEHVLEGVK